MGFCHAPLHPYTLGYSRAFYTPLFSLSDTFHLSSVPPTTKDVWVPTHGIPSEPTLTPVDLDG